MSKYPIVTFNGLHTPENRGGGYPNLDNLEEVISSVFSSEPDRNRGGRDINMYTGAEGMRQFEEAVVNLSREQIESMPTTRVGPITRASEDIARVDPSNLGRPLDTNFISANYVMGVDSISTPLEDQESTTVELPYNEQQMTMLQNGEIDMLTFLDNISNDSNT